VTKGTVLIVDDDRQMVKTIAAVLKLHGWTTFSAYSGEEAIQATTAHRFSAVLMDVKMPGINGVDAFRSIRQTRPGTPVILMTAYAAQELLDQAEREGALMIMPKPISWPALMGLLNQTGPDPRSVLLVDDDPDFLRSLAEILSLHGRDVLRATSLAEALACLDRPGAVPAVVVLDLRLEGIQPTQAAVAIKELSPAVILILCTGYPQLLDEAMSALPAEWVHAGLTKPFAPQRLCELLDAVTRQ
jgi:DNA-binding NtrC family response regulator